MKVKSLIMSLLLIFGGSMGTFALSLPALSTQAVSVDASVWDGTYATSVNEDDIDILGFGTDGEETSLTSATTIRIYTAKGFSYFAGRVNNGTTYANRTIYLENDIDLNGNAWIPIGGSDTYFMGTFDGNNNTIYNLTNNSSYPVFGLFARVEGEIRDVNLVGVNITYSGTLNASQYVGGIAGELHGGSVTGVSVRGRIYSNAYNATSYVGGLVGFAYDAGVNDSDTTSPAIIENSVNYASVSGVSNIGGLVGYADGDVRISVSSNMGTVSNIRNTSNTTINVGGLVGRQSSTVSKYLTIINAFNNGDMTLVASTSNVDVRAGGLLGSSDSLRSGSTLANYFKLQYVYNDGDFTVTGYSSASNRSVYIGGLVGFADSPINIFSDDSLISYAFNAGDVVSIDNSSSFSNLGSRFHFREIIATTLSQNVALGVSQNDVFYDYDAPYQVFYTSSIYNDLTNLIRVTHLDGRATSYEFLSTAPDKADGVYGVNFDFYDGTDGYWLLSETMNEGLPYLYTASNTEDANEDWDTTLVGEWEGDGTLASPYLIYTAEDLALVADLYNNNETDETRVTYFSLQNDLDLSSRAWEPIGINGYSFRYAVFDGNGHTISGINCSLQVDYNESVGLFGTIWNAVVRNVIIDDFRFVGSDDPSTSARNIHRATLVGNAVNSYVINCVDSTGFTSDNLTGDEVYTIANASSSYLIYGSNNIQGDSYTFGMENISETTMRSLTEGIETFLNTEGGLVYDEVLSTEDRTITPHLGDGRFVMVDNSVISVTLDSSINLYDATYMSSLPVDTIEAYEDDDYNNSFYIVKEGYKVIEDGYTCGDESLSSLSGTNSWLDLINLGITATWESAEDVEFKVYYNSYERYWRTVARTDGAVNYAGVEGADGNIDATYNHENDKSVTIYMPYNTFNSMAGLQAELSDAIADLNREKYEIAGVYETFENGVYGGTNLISSEQSNAGFFYNTDGEYFLKWQGTEERTNIITINFADTALTTSGAYADRFEWNEAIDTITIYFYSTGNNGTISAVDTQTFSASDIEDGQFNYNYSTDKVDEYFEYIEIQVELKFGFTYDMANYSNAFVGPNNIADNDDYASYISNYGSAFVISPTGITDWNVQIGQEVASYRFGQAVGDVELNLEIARSSNSFTLNVGEGIYFALALPVETQNVAFLEVLTEDGFVSLQEYNQDFVLNIANNSFTFGLNMFDDYMLSTASTFDMESSSGYIRFNNDSNFDYLLVRNYLPLTAQYQYYLYEYDISERTQTLYLVELVEEAGDIVARQTTGELKGNGYAFRVLDRIASIVQGDDVENGTSYTINFYTNQEFGLIFSTETDEGNITEYDIDSQNGSLEVILPTDNVDYTTNIRKIYYDFSKIKETGENFYSISLYFNSETMNIAQERITAKISIQFVDENGNILEETEEIPLPTIYIHINKTDSAEQGTEKWTRYTGSQITINPLDSQSMSLRIVNNEYYQWTYRQTDQTSTAVRFSEFSGQANGAFVDNGTTSSLDSQLYLNITRDGSLFDAEGHPYDYEELNQGSYLYHYFAVNEPDDSSEEIMGITGMIYESERTAFDFLMLYNESEVASSDGQGQTNLYYLPNYDFVLTFVLKSVDYSVSIETKYMQTVDGELYDDNTNESEVWTEEESGTIVSLDANSSFGVRTFSTEVSTRSTRANSASGYSFAGFRVIADEDDSIISEWISEETQTKYSSMLSFLEEYDEYLSYDYEEHQDSYHVDIQAIYISNTIDYEASGSQDLTNITDGRTIIENYNGTDSLRYLAQGISESRGLRSGTYYYGSSNMGESDELANGDFTFEMNEYYSNRYTFAGVALMNESNYLLASGNYDDSLYLARFDASTYLEQVTISNDGLNNITVDGDLIKGYFQNNIGSLSSQTIYIVPIVEQKTLLVSITSGASADEIVYDANGNVTTNSEIELMFYYNTATNIEFDKEYLKTKEDEYESYYLVSTIDSVILNDYFSKKQGYQVDGWVVYNEDETETTPIFISYYRLDENFFTSQYQDGSGEADYRIHIERSYTPNTYYINYSSGDERVTGSYVYGIATGATTSTLATVNTETEIAQNGFSLTGYTFLNWNTNIDGAGRSFEAGEVVDENLCTGDEGDTSITLYAQWSANRYDIEIIFNGGTYNEAESLLIEDITYNTPLFMLADIVPTRTGFTFDGFYTMSSSGIKSDYYLVDENTYFNSSLHNFNDVENEIAVTLYATWQYVGEIDLTVNDNTKTYSYTGENISTPLSEFYLSSSNLQFDFDDIFAIFSIYPDVIANYEFSGATFDGLNIILTRPSVNTYYVYIEITLVDDSEYYSIGEIDSVQGQFVFVIEPASVSYTLSSDYSLYYENIKYLASLVETSAEIERINGYGSFINMMNVLKINGDVDSNATINNTYEYLFMKYFKMVNTRIVSAESYDQFMTYRNWTYSDYLAYYDNTYYYTNNDATGDEELVDLTDERATRANVLANAFLLSYDVNNRISSAVLYGDGASGIYDASQFVLTSPTATNVAGEIQIDSIEVLSSNNMRTNTSYEVRAYLEVATGASLENYDLSFISVENSNRYYISLPNAYMLLQILKLENNNETQARFYNEETPQVQVSYIGENQNTYLYALDRETYTQFEEGSNFYINLQLYTSNLGSAEQDTVYNFYTAENHFDFSNYQVLDVGEDLTTNVTSDVNLLLSEDFYYTIYNVNETAQITLNSRLLTKEDGFIGTIDLDEQYYENLFSVTSFTYTLDGVNEITVENSFGLEDGVYYSEDGGVLLFEVTDNNTGSPVIISTEPLLSITIQAQTQLGQYIRLIDIGQVEAYSFEGDGIRTTGEYVFDLSEGSEEIIYDEGRVTEVDYYATFSDLVRVAIDYNLPINNDQMFSYLQLAQDTSDAISFPFEYYLTCESLAYVSSDGSEVDYTTIFTGEGGTYVGVTDNIFEQLNLKAYWGIGEIYASSLGTDFTQSVGTLESVSGYEVGYMPDATSELFDYYFEMVYMGTAGETEEVVAHSNNFDNLTYHLQNSGTLEHNGGYVIRITVTMKEEYRDILSNPEEYQIVNQDIVFSINLQPIHIVGIDYVGEENIEYDAQDHTNSFSLSVSYLLYDASIDGYDSEDVQQVNFIYNQDGMFDITIRNNNNIVTSIINVGAYDIEFTIDENYYLFDGEVDTNFVMNIVQRVIDLESENIELSKKFNMTDPILQYSMNLNDETLQFNFIREGGEDIGNYNLYLNSVNGFECSNLASNYQIVYGDVVLYNGTLQNLTTQVGNFEITISDTLRLSWLGSDLSVDYNEEGYRLQIIDGDVIAYAGDSEVQRRTLQAYDVSSGGYLNSNYAIIEPLLNYDNITLMLYNSTSAEIVYDSAVYEIRVEIKDGAEIANYYTNIIFDGEYIFQILPRTIDVSSDETFTFEKQYDGDNTLRVDLNGNVIDDSYEGVYILATFATYHAGENISVSLSLGATEGYNANNYSLSDFTAHGTILRRDAVISISPNYDDGEDSYIYGDLSRTNLADNLNISVLSLDETEDLTDIFYLSNYTLNLELDNAGANRLGYYYQGTYSVDIVSSSFADFNIEDINSENVTISPYTFNINLPENYITISTLDVVSTYSDTQTYALTGDTITLSYLPVGLTQGETGAVGQYDLSLNGSNSFVQNSIVVVLSAENSLQIVQTEEYIFLKIDDADLELLNLAYNGYDYILSVSVEDSTLVITNENASPINLRFSFFRKTSDGDEAYTGNITSVHIYLSGDVLTFKDAGSYRLNLLVEAEGVTNFAFYDNYTINVSSIEVDAGELDIVKTYDGTNRMENIDFAERVSDGVVSDNVSITAVFASSQVGENIDVTLYLVGTSARNYTFSDDINETLGDIIRADAVITLANDSLTYGSVMADTSFDYVVTSNGKTVSTTEYSVVSTIENGEYSSEGYLVHGSYTLNLVITSNNYNITPSALTFNITPFNLNFVFTNDGVYRTSYGSAESLTDTFTRDYSTIFGDTIEVTFVRENGAEVGYYEILSASVVNDNYQVESVTDNSTSGAYRITPSNERYYLLISSLDEISGNDRTSLNMQLTYDGLTYNSIEFVVDEQNHNYKTIISDSTNVSSYEYVLNLYSYDAEQNLYTKSDMFDATLSADLSFMTGITVRNAGDYSVYAENIESTNFDVIFGQSGTLSSYVLEISQKTLTYRVASVSKQFDNLSAILTYENAGDILDGIVTGDNVSLTLTMYDGVSIARYAGEGYTVVATLTNGGNYALSGSIEGIITKAPVGLYVESTTITYGQQPNFYYSIDYGDIDLTYYDRSEITVDISIENGEYSSSDNLRVNENGYSLSATLNANDFEIGYYLNDYNEQEDTLSATLIVEPRELSISQKDDILLQNVFSKLYDGTDEVTIRNEGNELLFNVGNIIEGDIVDVESARFSQTTPGSGISVIFTLSGNDMTNYNLSNYRNGEIRPIVVGIDFDYQAEDGETITANVDENSILTGVNYPFSSLNYLTANASDSSKTAFPTMLVGKSGFTFNGWTLNLTAQENTPEWTYLNNVLSTLNLSYTTSGDIYRISVGNNSATISLLDELLSSDVDYFNLFAGADSANVTFTANWIGNSYYLTLHMQDENGEDLGENYSSFATVEVNGSAMISSNYQTSVNHGDSVEIIVNLNDYIRLVGAYDALTGEEFSFDSNERVGNVVTYVINSVTSENNIALRFRYENISIVLDLQGYNGEVTFNDDRFVQMTNNRYVYTTSCSTLLSSSLLDLPELFRTGYSVTGYLFNGEIEVNSDDFASSLLLSYAVLSDSGYELTYSPIFDELNIEVILDYNYNNLTETIFVPYNGTFNSADNWIETPVREGYNFVNWTDDEGNIITGESVLTDIDGVTLTAGWSIMQNHITLALDENLMLLNSSVGTTYDRENGVYVFDELDYGETLTFTLQAIEGYMVDEITYTQDDIIFEDIEFEETSNGTIVTFTMPAPPYVRMTATSAVRRNNVTVSGEHFSFTASLDGTPIEVTDNSFSVDTGDIFTLNVTIETGYTFVSAQASSDNVGIEQVMNGNELTLTVSGVQSDVEISILTTERENSVRFNFDINDALNRLITNEQINTQNIAYVLTGESLNVYISLNEGYTIENIVFAYTGGATEQVQFEQIDEENNAYFGYYNFTIDNITRDAIVNVEIGHVTYQVTTDILVYDENGERVDDEEVLNLFTVLVNGEETIEVDYNSIITASYTSSTTEYNFAGWSLDGSTIISSDSPLDITITSNTTVYAIFSKTEFRVALNAYSYYVLNEEYGDSTLEEEVYDLIYAPFYDEDTEIYQSYIYYGSSRTITLRVPDGYTFLGYGYILNAEYSQAELIRGDFEYAYRNQSAEREIEITLDTLYMLSLGFGENGNNYVPFFVALAPNFIDFNISSYLDFDGLIEEDNLVADISLIGYENSESVAVNVYGYVSGTLNHYKDYTGNESTQNFTISTITNGEVYLKIGTLRNGYSLSRVVAENGAYVSTEYVSNIVEGDSTYAIYRLYNIIGSVSELGISVYFQPQKNIIDINFVNESGVVVNGGSLFLDVTDEMSEKVWSNGSNFSSLQVVGFTDTYFSVVAYVRLGFMIDINNINLSYDNACLTVQDVLAYQLDFAENNYNYVIYFNVSGLQNATTISINIESQTYRVVLNDISLDDPVVAIIDNVRFHETLDLSSANSANITSSLGYTNGMLNIVQSKNDYDFGGYFTYAGGRGVQYINSTGQTLREFTETGYILNEITGRYELSENAYVDTDGVMTINLYLYWSYLKTQITFSITPNLRANITAEDLVEGENSANSWFNEDMPLYIEVAFNTDITITAPEIEGYRFYKFVIRQRDANNNYLADVVSYTNDLPWSTDERDRIVEMTIEVYYFARVNVTLSGGEMEYQITQNSDDMYAQQLVNEGYVDTTKEFTLTALESSGYDFNYWYKVSTQQRYNTASFTDQITTYANYILAVQGKRVTLSFAEYDSTSGYIQSMIVTSNTRLPVTLGHLGDDGFVKDVLTYDVRVGNTVTFLVRADYGFGVSWNLEGIELSNIDSNYLYFTLEITGDMAETVVSVIPEFIGESMAIYVYRTFAEKDIIENATDGNDASYAGSVVYEGRAMDVILRDLGDDLTLNIVVNARYNITNIEFINYYGQTINVMANYDEELGTLYFTREEIDANYLAGTIRLNLEFERLYFEATDIDEQGAGTSNDPYLIYTIEDLTYYMEKINSGAVNENGRFYEQASYRVMSDLVLTEKFWTPIGTNAHPFNGTFNFNGHIISNIYLAEYYNPTSYGGLFGVIGYDARIYRNEESRWYIFIIIIIIIILLILLIILLIYNKKKKEKREELNTK